MCLTLTSAHLSTYYLTDSIYSSNYYQWICCLPVTSFQPLIRLSPWGRCILKMTSKLLTLCTNHLKKKSTNIGATGKNLADITKLSGDTLKIRSWLWVSHVDPNATPRALQCGIRNIRVVAEEKSCLSCGSKRRKQSLTWQSSPGGQPVRNPSFTSKGTNSRAHRKSMHYVASDSWFYETLSKKPTEQSSTYTAT